MNRYWFIFCDDKLLLHKDGNSHNVPLSVEPPCGLTAKSGYHNITPLNDIDVKTFTVSCNVSLPPNYFFVPLRQSYSLINRELYLKAGKCREILYWDVNTQYCGICGCKNEMATDISKRCTGCGNEIWPQLSTAIICLISRGDELLLVRANNFKHNFYGLVAGFVETGENLEDAVVREVEEETGLKIANIRYFGSQAWPYPCGLMVGFNADYVSGEIHLQESELKTGGWFNYKELPPIPEKLSIARQLIDNFLESRQH